MKLIKSVSRGRSLKQETAGQALAAATNVGCEECESKMSSNNKTRIKIAACALAAACVLVFGFLLAKPATGAVSAVNFKTPTFENGGNLKVDGGKTLTYGNGNLVAGETSTGKVKASDAPTAVSSWTLNYGSDPLTASLSKTRLVDAATIDLCSFGMPYSEDDYWLSDTTTMYGYSLRAYRMYTNNKGSSSRVYWENQPTSWIADTFCSVYTLCPDGTKIFDTFDLEQSVLSGWDFAKTEETTFYWPENGYLTSPYIDTDRQDISFTTQTATNTANWLTSSSKAYVQVRSEGQEVWNNPLCLEDASKGYYKTTFKSLSRSVSGADASYTSGSAASLKSTFYSKIKTSCNIPFYCAVSDGENISAGDTLFACDVTASELTNSTGFEQQDGYCKTYFKASSDAYVYGTGTSGASVYTAAGTANILKLNSSGVGGDTKFHTMANRREVGDGTNVENVLHAVRPMMTLDTSKVAFFRNATSGKTLTTASTLGNEPASKLEVTATSSNAKKAVVKSSDVTISLSSKEKDDGTSPTYTFTTNLDSGRDHLTTFTNSDGTITAGVPNKATSITISNITTNNAAYISALLQDTQGNKHYAVLKAATNGSTNSVTIDLSDINIFNTYNIGEEVTVSLYAENPSAANTSDAISATPATFKMKVISGRKSTLTYSGGSTYSKGTLPSAVTEGAGANLSLATGADIFDKTGNPVVGWTVTYNPYGGGSAVSQTYLSGEQFTMPDTADGKVSATAIYSGTAAIKTTEKIAGGGTKATVNLCLYVPSGSGMTLAVEDKTHSKTTTANKNNSSSTTNYMRMSFQVARSSTGTGQVASSTIPVTVTGTDYSFVGWTTSAANAAAGKADAYPITVSTGTKLYPVWKKSTIKVTWYNGSTTYTTEHNQGAKVARNTSVEDGISGKTFVGWYTDSKLTTKATAFWNTDTSDDPTVSEGLKYYGKWIDTLKMSSGDCWLQTAGASSPSSPSSDSSSAVTTSTINKEISILKAGEGNRNYSTTLSKWNTYLNEDKMHLYTKYSGGSGANAFVEFRIVSVGGHNTYAAGTSGSSLSEISDGSTVTFMATHALPTAYAMTTKTNSSGSVINSGGWGSSELRTKMQSGGEIYKNFSSGFTSALASVTKTSSPGGAGTGRTNHSVTTSDKLWVASFAELGAVAEENKYFESYTPCYEGEMYDWCRSKSINSGGVSNGNTALLNIGKTRANGYPSGGTYAYSFVWERSPDVGWSSDSGQFCYVDDYGRLLSCQKANVKLGVVPMCAF